MAPPTALTPHVQSTILRAIGDGNYRHTACAAAGVHRNSLYNWEKKAEEGIEPYASFFDKLRVEEAKAEIALLAEIRAATMGDAWTSRAWIMERRFPKFWAARVRTAVADEVDNLTKKLTRDPELHRRVVDALASEEPAGASAANDTH